MLYDKKLELRDGNITEIKYGLVPKTQNVINVLNKYNRHV